MKILFLARHYAYFRNYESVIAALAGTKTMKRFKQRLRKRIGLI